MSLLEHLIIVNTSLATFHDENSFCILSYLFLSLLLFFGGRDVMLDYLEEKKNTSGYICLIFVLCCLHFDRECNPLWWQCHGRRWMRLVWHSGSQLNIFHPHLFQKQSIKLTIQKNDLLKMIKNLFPLFKYTL